MNTLIDWLEAKQQLLAALLHASTTWSQLALGVAAVLTAGLLQARIQANLSPPENTQPAGAIVRRLLQSASPLLLPLLAALLLVLSEAIAQVAIGPTWLLRCGLVAAVLVLLHRAISLWVASDFAANTLRCLLLPIAALHLLGLLEPVVQVLNAMAIKIGNLEFTVSGLIRTLLFGGLLFWLGWLSNDAGQSMIRRQLRLDLRTREVIAKLFQLTLILVVFLLLMQVMGIDLTALAVFGGALGVGLGFGLQSIASNFVSGIIILFDRSVALGDYIETEEGQGGYVRELSMRHTTLETFDGKDVLVPNEKFITTPFTNWTHKNKKQRYRVDFSVAYDTDVRQLCDLIRSTVATHPQVLSGEDVPIEERPDCEIDSFGDSGVNMFVEFWMEGVDDGYNRVGGDLLLLILETLQQNGIQIPFPQREVRVLEPQNAPTNPERSE